MSKHQFVSLPVGSLLVWENDYSKAKKRKYKEWGTTYEDWDYKTVKQVFKFKHDILQDSGTYFIIFGEGQKKYHDKFLEHIHEYCNIIFDSGPCINTNYSSRQPRTHLYIFEKKSVANDGTDKDKSVSKVS